MSKIAIDHVEVRWRPVDSAGAWTTEMFKPSNGALMIPGIQRGVSYQIEARNVGVNGAASAWTQQTYVVSGEGIPPSDIAAILIQPLVGGIWLSWTPQNQQNSDVSYIVYRCADKSGAPGGVWAKVGDTKGSYYTEASPDSSTYWYRIQAVNYIGLTSAFSAAVSITNSSPETVAASVQAAQAAATAAQSSATAAQAQLNNIASDNLLSAGEKSAVIRDVAVITGEQAGIDAQASAYGITTAKTAYDSAVTALSTYLATLTTPSLWSTTGQDTTIVGTTFRSTFQTVYTARQALLNAIYAAAQVLANAAQSTANTAALNASAAATAAANAQTSANTANTSIGTISSDNMLSTGEKSRIIQDKASADGEKTDIDAKALAYSVSATAYDAAYTELGRYLSAAHSGTDGVGTGGTDWSNVATNSAIDGPTFRSKWSNYFTQRQLLLNAISAKALAITNTSGPSENLIPNGDFPLGDANGWFVCDGSGSWMFTGNTDGGNTPGVAIGGGTSIGVAAPPFRVVPGQKYSFSYRVYAGSGTQSVRLRVIYSSTYSSPFSRSGFTDFLTTSVAGGWTTYTYDWTVPSGVYWAAAAVYEWGGSAELFVSRVSCISYAAMSGYMSGGALILDESTPLNGQGSIIPGQSFSISFSNTATTITFSWGALNLLRADGSYQTVNAGSSTYSGLTASTAYYFYPYVNVAGQTIGFCTGPSTTGSALLLQQSQLDGRIPFPLNISTQNSPYTASTAATGGNGSGSGGGGNTCPESSEIVEVQGKGKIKAGDVALGDLIRGHSFKNGADVYRKVIQKTSEPCAAWRMISSHRVSPCEPVYSDGQWMPAFRVSGATHDEFIGRKMLISVQSDEYDESNYYLCGPTELLIHNVQPNPIWGPC